jgi:hypothetical protein
MDRFCRRLPGSLVFGTFHEADATGFMLAPTSPGNIKYQISNVKSKILNYPKISNIK